MADQSFYLFKNSSNYALALWFQETSCKKRDVNSFFNSQVSKHYKNGVAYSEPEPRLRFVNRKQWLSQFDQIPTGICDSNLRELRLTVETKVKRQNPSIVKVQYNNVYKVFTRAFTVYLGSCVWPALFVNTTMKIKKCITKCTPMIDGEKRKSSCPTEVQ